MKSKNRVQSLSCSSLASAEAARSWERRGPAGSFPRGCGRVSGPSPECLSAPGLSPLILCIVSETFPNVSEKPKRPREAVTLGVKLDAIKHFDRG